MIAQVAREVQQDGEILTFYFFCASLLAVPVLVRAARWLLYPQKRPPEDR
jgi:hypothetical protein